MSSPRLPKKVAKLNRLRARVLMQRMEIFSGAYRTGPRSYQTAAVRKTHLERSIRDTLPLIEELERELTEESN